MNDNTNFFIAIALSLLILAGWHWLYDVPKQKALAAQAVASKILQADAKSGSAASDTAATPRDRAEIIKDSARIVLRNDKMHGSINLRGARFDDLTLATYHETVDPKSAEIMLLSPAGSAEPHQPYYAEFGWLAPDNKGLALPDSDTIWQADGNTLEAGKTVTLRWNNNAGLIFERSIAMDDQYMFTITQKVKNSGSNAVTLFPFGLISRHGMPHTLGYSALHEGPLGVLDGQLKEKTYKALKENPLITQESQGGWVGITDAYWLTSIIPAQDDKITAHFVHGLVGATDHFQADMQGSGEMLKAGGEISSSFHFFAGAKEVEKLDAYEKQYHIPMFDKAVDFGWFYFIAKPFFYLLEFLGKMLGNYGLAIIVFTICLRLLFYPLSESSYTSMARMKELQPEMEKIKLRNASDPMKMNEEMAALYKREKINPMGGCLPVLIQIPVFFALYKVLLVSIEMRHAPFFGWIKDLSAPDPTNLFSLFGLLPLDLPSWVPHLGAWPLLMGITMFAQQKLSPPPADKTTAQMFTFMPVLFTFLLAKMSAGLVIYWTLSNLLAVLQQTVITRRIAAKKANGQSMVVK